MALVLISYWVTITDANVRQSLALEDLASLLTDVCRHCVHLRLLFEPWFDATR
jgi:hypothetical protein